MVLSAVLICFSNFIQSVPIKNQSFVTNHPRIALESINGETIIIDFETGLYYSARNEAYIIIELMLSGLSLQEIMDTCVQYSKLDAELVFPLVEGYIAALLEAEIIVPAAEATQVTDLTETSATKEQDASLLNHAIWTTGTFNAPVLESFKDMQELLLMDPIHDTTPKGWPEKK